MLLVNEMETPFSDKIDGRPIVIPPGKAAKVKAWVAYHFIGDPRMLNSDDENEKAAERKRVNLRYGAYKSEMVAGRVPRLRIEPVAEEEVKIVDVKPDIVPSLGEEEFPELKTEGSLKCPICDYTCMTQSQMNGHAIVHKRQGEWPKKEVK